MGAAAVSAESHRTAELKGAWNGTLDQFSQDMEGTFPVKMTIASISGDEFEGTMEWPSFNDCKTEIRGKYDGEVIIWTEIAYLKGNDVVLHGLYVGRINAIKQIEGEWMDPKHTIYPRGPNYGTAGASILLKKE